MELRFHHSLFLCKGGEGATVSKLIEPDHLFEGNSRTVLCNQMLEYRERLRALGIPVSSHYSLVESDLGLVETTVHCGTDAYEVIRSGGNAMVSPTQAVGRIMEALLRLLAQPELDVTIDPHPANWCFDAQGELRYIDFAPPRYRLPDCYLVGFPQPTNPEEYQYALGRYYSPLGIIRSLRFSAMRAGGRDMEAAILAALESYPPELGRPLLQALADLPERQFRDGALLAAVMADLDAWRIDDLRDVATVVADKMSKAKAEGFLNCILELTRVDFRLPLEVREDKVRQAKAYILSCA